MKVPHESAPGALLGKLVYGRDASVVSLIPCLLTMVLGRRDELRRSAGNPCCSCSSSSRGGRSEGELEALLLISRKFKAQRKS